MAGHAGRLLHAAADTLAEDGFGTACAWVLAADAGRLDFLTAAGWAPDGSKGNLDMGVKVPVLRLHTLLARRRVAGSVGHRRSLAQRKITRWQTRVSGWPAPGPGLFQQRSSRS